MTVSYFLQTLMTRISGGMVSYVMVTNMSLITNGVNMINFGQDAFFVLGTYLCYLLVPVIGFVPTLVIIPFVVGLLGRFVERAMRPLFGENILYITLLTFGMTYVVCDAMVMIWEYSIRLLTPPKFLNGSIAIFGIRSPVYYLFMIVVDTLIAFAPWFMVDKAKLGMLMRATIEDREVVVRSDTNVGHLFFVMFMIGIGVAELGDMINASITDTSPRRELSIFGSIIPVLAIGGIRNMSGCLPAALLVSLVNAFGIIFFPQFYNLLPIVLMAICMFIRPNGVFPGKEV